MATNSLVPSGIQSAPRFIKRVHRNGVYKWSIKMDTKIKMYQSELKRIKKENGILRYAVAILLCDTPKELKRVKRERGVKK